MGVELSDHQLSAIERLHNGAILWGGVGRGKSRTAIAYYFIKVCGGTIPINGSGSWGDMTSPRDLLIITTPKKRDSLEWQAECVPFTLSADENGKPDPEHSTGGINVTIDSWYNIKKYTGVQNNFVIFDEQRVVGKGAWVKAFLKITKRNRWILLSATPGDTWSDYIPVFLANGFFRNPTEFSDMHIVYKPYMNYPVVDHYVNEGRLIKMRNYILVPMKLKKETERHHLTILVEYDKPSYKKVWLDRWNVFDNEPIEETGKLCYLLRKVVNADERRAEVVSELFDKHDRAIIFYNYDYELMILRSLAEMKKIKYAEWNGKKHEELPTGEKWLYFVQYTAGAEGWNCITTDTIIFYSQNYSYKMTEQAEGRIDRMNTPYKDLYYYHVRSNAPIDIAILRALKEKRNFNERAFLGAK